MRAAKANGEACEAGASYNCWESKHFWSSWQLWQTSWLFISKSLALEILYGAMDCYGYHGLAWIQSRSLTRSTVLPFPKPTHDYAIPQQFLCTLDYLFPRLRDIASRFGHIWEDTLGQCQHEGGAIGSLNYEYHWISNKLTISIKIIQNPEAKYQNPFVTCGEISVLSCATSGPRSGWPQPNLSTWPAAWFLHWLGSA